MNKHHRHPPTPLFLKKPLIIPKIFFFLIRLSTAAQREHNKKVNSRRALRSVWTIRIRLYPTSRNLHLFFDGLTYHLSTGYIYIFELNTLNPIGFICIIHTQKKMHPRPLAGFYYYYLDWV